MKTDYLRVGLLACAITLTWGLNACTGGDSPSSAATGPGIESSAGGPLGGSVPPAVGGSGNGGGLSGGGAGAGGVGQGSR